MQTVSLWWKEFKVYEVRLNYRFTLSTRYQEPPYSRTKRLSSESIELCIIVSCFCSAGLAISNK